jgi:hypothetical protein
MKLEHRAGDGRHAAAHTLPVDVPKVLGEFRKLNTRESRAAFADHWIGIWARDFDKSWQVIYELLKIVEEDELYKDPRRVGPQAPGFPKETHSQESSYPDFAAYFTERVKQPLDRWAELERTYQYAQRYAPEIFELQYADARKMAEPGAPVGNQNRVNTSNKSRITRIDSLGHSQTVANIRGRLLRDSQDQKRPQAEREKKAELLAKIERCEISAHKAAIEADYRQPMIQHRPTVQGFLNAAQTHLSPEQRLELKEAL